MFYTDSLSQDIPAAVPVSQQTAYEQDLHPDEPLRSDRSVGSRLERMELASDDLSTITEQSSQSAVQPADEIMDQCMTFTLANSSASQFVVCK